MHVAFQPGTIVFGARPVLSTSIGGAPVQARDKKGRPLWHMPQPCRYAIHFKTEYARRRYEAELSALDEKDPEFKKKVGEIERRAKYAVPIFAGLSRSTARRVQATVTYRNKLTARSNPVGALTRRFIDSVKTLGDKFINRGK